MPTISCPHCGTKRNMPQEKLPAHKVRARCPQCRQTFNFDPTDHLPHRNAAKITTRSIDCPHCSLPRELSTKRLPGNHATLTCRRCRRNFHLNQNQTDPGLETTAPRKLISTGKLLTDSWELFRQRGWGLLGLYLLCFLLIFAPLALAALTAPKMIMNHPWLIWSCLLLGISYAVIGSAWITASMFHYIVDSSLGVKTALALGRQQLWNFAGLLLLWFLLIAGGSLLLIIPGVIFTIWFLFCQYVLAEERVGGLKALEKSRQLVRDYWWPVFGRFMLLLLLTLTISNLAGRIPAIGSSINLVLSLLLTPFSLFYYYLLYEDLKRCPRRPSRDKSLNLTPLLLALCGWLLIPAVLFFANHQGNLSPRLSAGENRTILNKLFDAEEFPLAEFSGQSNPPPKRRPPEPLTQADYERLLAEKLLPENRQELSLGPATLSAEQFWADEKEPHLWLKLRLAELPNLALSPRRSARILIREVLDSAARNRYDHLHSFENPAFQWVDILSGGLQTEQLSGIRSVYLKQGTRLEQIRSIRGCLEINLPLGIKTLQLDRADIGKKLKVAGKFLQLESFDKNRVSLIFQGKLSEILSIQAVNRQHEALQDAGINWQQHGEKLTLSQMFSGEIDSVTILVAGDSITRSYPFEITR